MPFVGLGVAFLVLLALVSSSGSADAASNTNLPDALKSSGGKPLPIDIQQKIAAILTILTVGPDGKIAGPITPQAIQQATMLTAQVAAAGFAAAATTLRQYISAAQKLLPPVPANQKIPLPSSIPQDLQDAINRALQVERDPAKLQAIVNALKALPSSPQVTAAISLLEALIAQVQAAAEQAAVLTAIQKKIGTPAPAPRTTMPVPGASTTVPVPPTLRSGSTDASSAGNVSVWQKILNANGASLTVDGKFGPLSVSMTQAFQAYYHLSVDGVVGPQTWQSGLSNAPKKILSGGAPSAPAPTPGASTTVKVPPTLRQGSSDTSTGGSVSAWQRILNANGASLTVDGQFGPLSTTMTKALQAYYHLSTDGIVGPQTWQAGLSNAPKPILTGGASAPAATAPRPAPTVTPKYPTIQQGSTDASSGGAVSLWQRALVASGITVATDGQFGPATKAGTQKYQTAHGLSADGIVGPQTWGTVVSSVSGSYVGNMPMARRPVEIAAIDMVKNLKNVQAQFGMPGARGKENKALVRRFQHLATGGKTTDGKAGSGTLLLAAVHGQPSLPLVMYWPKDASAANVHDYQTRLAAMANVCEDPGTATALRESAARERGQGAKSPMGV